MRYSILSILVIITWLIVLPLSVFGETITIEEAIQSAIARSSALRQSKLRVASSIIREEEVLENMRPTLSFVSDPAYGLATRRAPGLMPPLVPTAEEPSTLLVNSASAGISLTQPLSTAGVVSGALRGGFSISSDFPDDGEVSSAFAFEPSLSLSITQPVFVDGAFLDTEQPMLAAEQAQRATRELTITGDLIARETAAAVVALYTQLGTLRRAFTLQSAQRELLLGQLEQAEIRSSLGQASAREQLALQVQINRLDDVRLQSSLAINEIELELSELTGLPFTRETELEPVSELSARAGNLLSETASGVTPEKLAADEALRRAETNLLLARKQPQATVNGALSLTPRYADDRADKDKLWGSVSDYFGEGAGVDIALSLGLSVPLGEKTSREREIRQAEIAVDLAREEAENTANDALHQQRLFEIRISSLADRIELLKFELDFQESQLDTELELLELGVSTESEVAAIRSDILTADIELENLEAQLFLARMDLAAARGFDLATVVAPAE